MSRLEGEEPALQELPRRTLKPWGLRGANKSMHRHASIHTVLLSQTEGLAKAQLLLHVGQIVVNALGREMEELLRGCEPALGFETCQNGSTRELFVCFGV